jgi:hypothetical protein
MRGRVCHLKDRLQRSFMQSIVAYLANISSAKGVARSIQFDIFAMFRFVTGNTLFIEGPIPIAGCRSHVPGCRQQGCHPLAYASSLFGLHRRSDRCSRQSERLVNYEIVEHDVAGVSKESEERGGLEAFRREASCRLAPGTITH